MSHPQMFVPDDAVIADVRLTLRGVQLPLDVLGGRRVAADHIELAPGVIRLTLPPELADRAAAAGSLLLADAEGKPLATVIELAVARADETGALVSGRLEPVEAAAWEPLASGLGESDRPVTVVVATRPLLPADVARIRSLGGTADVVLAVPVGGPSPDGLPGPTLLRLAHRALADDATESPVNVVPVDLAWRNAACDAALADAVARALGAAEATTISDGAGDWGRLLAGLDGEDEQLPEVADQELVRELRRWRPPRDRRGLVVLLTGLSGSGKSTLARALAAHVQGTTDRTVSLLDGDLVRRLLSSGLGYDHAARDLNVRRIGFVAAEIARHGGLAICAPIAPYAESRAAVRAMVEEVGDFVLVHVSTPLAEAERRDVKGLYAQARAGLIENFTGISDRYEEPTDADLTLDTSELSVEDALTTLVGHLEQHGWLSAPRGEA